MLYGKIRFVFLWMLFNHVLDDYFLQGILSQLKQKSWWIENMVPEDFKFYKNDYRMALVMHSISWTFMIMLPIAVYFNFVISNTFIVVFVINMIIHAWIDDLKANQKRINLCQDQIGHIVQIIYTFISLVYIDYCWNI